MKSLDKKKPKELDWEEDFCRQVRFYCGGDLDYKTELKPLVKTVYSLLQKQRTELLEEIMKLEIGEFEGWDLAKKFNCCPGDDMADAYNQALKDVIKNLKQK